MARATQLDKAIQNLKDQRAVIDLAIRQLEAQQVPKVKRSKPAKAEAAS
jgi:hypothetical protein